MGDGRVGNREHLTARIHEDSATDVVRVVVANLRALYSRIRSHANLETTAAACRVVRDGGVGQIDRARVVDIYAAAVVFRRVARDGAARHLESACHENSGTVVARMVVRDGTAHYRARATLVDVNSATVVRPTAGDGSASCGITNGEVRVVFQHEDVPLLGR